MAEENNNSTLAHDQEYGPCPYADTLQCEYSYRHNLAAQKFYDAMISGDGEIKFFVDSQACRVRPDYCERFMEHYKSMTRGR